MRVEIVTDTFAPDVNGVAMTLGRLVGGLRARGHLVHVWHTAERHGDRGETNLPSVPLPGYKEVRLGLPGGTKLHRRWKKKRPDAVYVATESPLGRSAVKAAASLRIPVAAGFHTNFDQYLERYRLRGLKPAALAYLKKVHNHADCTFAPSAEVVERLQREGFENVCLLGRGVDTDLFRPARRDAGLRGEWGAGPGGPVALLVGRVAPEKNLAFAMEVLGEMRSRVPDLRSVVVGDGPLRERLQREHPHVEFVGTRTGENLARHYASADILLFPSETETFGNVLLEGMASGLATVSYDYAASARHVTHGQNGLKVPLGNQERFGEEAARALDLQSMADIRAAARRCVEPHGWDRVIDSFEARLRHLGIQRVSRRTTGSKKPRKLRFETIFLSDIHLGTEDSKDKKVTDFLEHTECKRLVLNGDIVDGWALRPGGKWRKSHTRFVRSVLKMMEKKGVEVICLRGNHDDILDRFLPLAFGGIRVAKDYIHKAKNGKKYLVIHGDGFDTVSTNHRWLAMAGAAGYNLLVKVNRLYNHYRAWRGKEYFSMSKAVKTRVKGAVSFVDRYQEQLQALAQRRHCDGIICGHIHPPADEQVGGIHYLNSGDCGESLSCVVEHEDGRFEVLFYDEFLGRVHGAADGPPADRGEPSRPQTTAGSRPEHVPEMAPA